MGLESVYRLSVILNLVDNLSGQMDNATGSIGKLNSAFETMQKASAAMMGVGTGIVGLALGTAKATFDTQNALGELASLGVKDLQAVEDAAKSFSDTWAGTSKSDFITASYDIKSGIASLTDEGVAQFTQLAALTGKATKSTTEEMGSLFATGYGIYKGFYEDMSDLEFGEMFSSGIATAVKNYKTSGSEMASSISALGATATNANVPLEEQLAILGQLQTTMSGSEAATKYKSFLNQASSAGEKLGLTFLDSNNQLLSMPEILTALKSKYGDTIDAVEKRELKEAFGTDEAVALIDLLYNNIETLDGGIQDLQQSMKSGIAVTEEMAAAINNTPEQKFQVLKQQIHNNVEELGKGLLPVVNDTLDKVSGLISRGSEWIKNNQGAAKAIMNIVLGLGIFLVIAGGVIGVVGTAGKVFIAASTAIGFVKTAIMGMNTAFLASPITWVIIGIVALAAAFAVLWNKSETFRNFWLALFAQVRGALAQAWAIIQPVLQELGQKFMELWQAVQPILKLIGAGFGMALTVAVGIFAGAVQGMVAALEPLANALSSMGNFVTNIVNMIVAIFKGDFAGAMDFASAAAGDLKDFLFNCFDAILSFIGGFASGFLDVVDGVLSAVGIDASETISEIKNTVKNGLETVKGFFDNIMGAAENTVKERLSNMKSAYEEHGGGIQGIAAAAMEGVKGGFTAGFSFIDNLTGGRLTEIKGKFKDKMQGVVGTVTTSMQAAKDHVSTKLSDMQEAYQEHGGGIKGIVAATMKGVQGSFQTAYSTIDTLTGGKLSSIKEKITSGLQGACDVVNGKLGNMANRFNEKMTAARDFVNNGIEKIKSLFNITFPTPKIKMPHVSVTGSFSLDPPSIPKFGIEWYKDGGILNGATIFGARGGNLLGGGEAGAEAVLPLAELWKQMREIIGDILETDSGNNENSLQRTGGNITSILTSKAEIIRREKETVTTREAATSERRNSDHGTTIQSIQFTVDISKIKDLPLLYKLIDELKDAQNRTEPVPSET